MNRGDGERLPAWAFEPVRLVEHDPSWAHRAVVLARELHEVFAGRLIGDVVHVGSTAVPGLPAKPIIDLQAASHHPAAAVAACGAAARAARWMVVPRELDRRPWRWFLVRIDREGRSRLAHLHLMRPGEARWDAQLRLRDRLRADAELRADYAALKEQLAADHHDDREAYPDAKKTFVLRVLEDG